MEYKKVAVFLGNTLLDFLEVPSVYRQLTESELISTIQVLFDYPENIQLENV